MLPLAVVMSVYSGDKPEQIRESLDSILTQSIAAVHQIRVYLVVDGPVEASINAVLSEYRYEVYKKICLSSNQGLAHALNVLIGELEDEPFVFRMDADDISLPDRFERQLSFMHENPEVDILGGAIVEFGESLDVGCTVTYPKDNKAARAQIAIRSPVAHPTVCFRRRVFDTVPLYPVVSGNEDIAFWFECMNSGLIFANVSDPVLRFRVSPGFWNRRGLKKSATELKCYLDGLYTLEGFSLRMFYPTLRFFFRLMPSSLRKFGYRMRAKRAN